MKRREEIKGFLCDTIGHRWDYHLGGAKRSCKRCPVVEWRSFDSPLVVNEDIKLRATYFSL